MLHAQMALVKIARRKLGAIDARMAEHELKVCVANPFVYSHLQHLFWPVASSWPTMPTMAITTTITITTTTSTRS